VNGDLEGNCVADGRWFDIYTFSGLAGQPISISMSSSVFNTYLYLLSPSGAFIAEDDNGGGGTNARIPSGSGTFALPSTGTYTVYATSFFANETGGYTITLSGPPLNDLFANAAVINSYVGTFSGNNINATKESGEPSHAGNAGGKSVWFRWIAPNTGRTTFGTSVNNFNTLLAVYTGSTLNGLSLVASNDDYPSLSCSSSSSVTFNTTAGTEYRIAVDGFNNSSGDFTLNWLPTPANDDFANAVLLPDSSGTIGGSNAGATKESGEPNHASSSGGRSIWYRWQAP